MMITFSNVCYLQYAISDAGIPQILLQVLQNFPLACYFFGSADGFHRPAIDLILHFHYLCHAPTFLDATLIRFYLHVLVFLGIIAPNAYFRLPVYFSLPYLPHYLELSQERDAQDCNRVDCRNDDKLTILAGLSQKLFRILTDVLKILYREMDASGHNRFCHTNLTIPNISYHYKKYWISLCRFSPRNYLYFSVINFSYQHLHAGQSPTVHTRAGNLIFNNYNMVYE